MTIVEFLLTCIAEDYQEAGDPSWCDCAVEGFPLIHGIICPVRLHAECEAKRGIVEIYQGAENAKAIMTTADDGSFEAVTAIGMINSVMVTLEGVMKLHAATYSDRPGYDEAWRP